MELLSKIPCQPTNWANDKEFQIAVEDSNVGAKRLYEKIGFVKQTQVVYLNEKGARDSEV